MESPPPPPPHGSRTSAGGRGKGPKSSGLPDGKYDIFVIPPSSAGSGFLYLPSLQTHRNSFLAGVVCTSASFFFYSVAVPVIKEWFHKTVNSGGSGVIMLVASVGIISWALGKTQGEGFGESWKPTESNTGPSHKKSRRSRSKAPESESDDDSTPPPRRPPPQETPPHQSHSQHAGADPGYAGTPPPQQPQPQQTHQPPPPPPQAAPPPQDPPPQTSPPKSSWQRPTTDPKAKAEAKSSWEKAREETRKREEDKRRQEELKRRREELEKERLRQREREARERLERELKEKKERELKEAAVKREREERDAAVLKEKREREEKDRKEKEEKEEKERKEKLERDERERRERDIREAVERERKNREMAEKEKELRDKEEALRKETERINAERIKAAVAAAAAQRKPPTPTAKTEKEDDTYSFRPYDRAKSQKTRSAGSVYSEDSYAPSATTAKTTPPASDRGPYTTKDPDKIIIKAVYSFNNAFTRTPIAQLISGQGTVTDGLILRITTEGLFIDDDVRGVPQREWDVKAWTMKLAETCELSGMHVLRASIRDQEGKKYVFIIGQSEGWKVALGLQRLRKGSQVRALGVAGMPMNEAKVLLDNLGWT